MTELTTAPAALSIRGLEKRYGDTVVLRDFDLDVAAGEVVCILGANGSGKSTALRCVVGLTRPDGGTITVDGATVEPGARVAGAAMVFQKIHLVPRRSVLDNVCAGALGGYRCGSRGRPTPSPVTCVRRRWPAWPASAWPTARTRRRCACPAASSSA